jgi:hypothetical protein
VCDSVCTNLAVSDSTVVWDYSTLKVCGRIWIYVPTKVSEDTAFPFKIGAPCLVKIDEEKKQLVVKQISDKEATELGWRKRIRRKHANE